MALSIRHTARLLSPGESLLCALLSAHPRASPRPRFHQQRPISDRQKARALPEDFDIHRLLQLQRQPIHIQEAKKLPQHTLDEAIESRWVQVKDRETNKMATPQMLESLIATLDRRTHSVVLLSMTGPTPNTALVAVQPRAELLEDALQKQQSKSKGGVKVKQIELNWAISEHDLALKLKKMEQLLGKGHRVEMMLANKKRQRRAEAEEAETTLKKVRDRVLELGISERNFEGKIGAQATLVIENRHREATEATEAIAAKL